MKPLNCTENPVLIASHIKRGAFWEAQYQDDLYITSYGVYYVFSIHFDTDCTNVEYLSMDDAKQWLSDRGKTDELQSHFGIKKMEL